MVLSTTRFSPVLLFDLSVNVFSKNMNWTPWAYLPVRDASAQTFLRGMCVAVCTGGNLTLHQLWGWFFLSHRGQKVAQYYDNHCVHSGKLDISVTLTGFYGQYSVPLWYLTPPDDSVIEMVSCIRFGGKQNKIAERIIVYWERDSFTLANRHVLWRFIPMEGAK